MVGLVEKTGHIYFFDAHPGTIWFTASIVTESNSNIGPSAWGLLAQISFKPQDLESLSLQAKKHENDIPSHFPIEKLSETTKSHFEKDQKGQYFTTNLTPYDASSFLKEPRLNGATYIISDTTLLLYLYTI